MNKGLWWRLYRHLAIFKNPGLCSHHLYYNCFITDSFSIVGKWVSPTLAMWWIQLITLSFMSHSVPDSLTCVHTQQHMVIKVSGDQSSRPASVQASVSLLGAVASHRFLLVPILYYKSCYTLHPLASILDSQHKYYKGCPMKVKSCFSYLTSHIGTHDCTLNWWILSIRLYAISDWWKKIMSDFKL